MDGWMNIYTIPAIIVIAHHDAAEPAPEDRGMNTRYVAIEESRHDRVREGGDR